MSTLAKSEEYKRRFQVADYTERWAVIMTKVAIRQAVSRNPWPRWHFVSFCGREGGESRGIVDMIAIRKNHGLPRSGLKRGDALQIVLIQVKGGYAPKPTAEDAKRLRIVERCHGACASLLATWKKGQKARFFALHGAQWREIEDLHPIFG